VISVVVPVRDEPEIATFLLRLHEVLGDLREPYEVVVVTSDKEQQHTPIPALPHQKVFKSYGDSLERAILLGFSVAEGEKIVVMDSDGSHPPETIPKLVEVLSEHELVVASRFLPESRFNYSLFRRVVSWVFVKYAQLLGSRLSDPMSGFFAVRKSLVEKLRFKPVKWKVALEIELKSRVNTSEVAFTFRKRSAGYSKAKIFTGLKILWDVFWVVI